MSHRETDSSVCLRTPLRVLIYDSLSVGDDLALFVQQLGYEVEEMSDTAHALQQFHQRDFPLVLIRTDEQGTGLDFIAQSKTLHDSRFLAVTNCSGCQSAILALRAGAHDYIVWPGCAEEIKHALFHAYEAVGHARFKEDMLSMLTHDIKIPLSSILGYSALIFDPKNGELHPRARDFVKTINGSGLKILYLLDNFLTTTKIDAGRLHLCLDPVDIASFLEDLAGTFHAEVDRHRLRLELELERDLPAVEADEGLLFRAVGNLLSNACKYSPVDSLVRISARRAAVGGDGQSDEEISPGITIEVSNPGPGLTVEEIPEIFERFRRGHAQGSIEGSGLGAYVVKSIVEAHNGNVMVESVPNGLTTFRIWLPLKVL